MAELEDRKWYVASWSREAARGTVQSDRGRVLPFDASVMTVGDLNIGESVRVVVGGHAHGDHAHLVEPLSNAKPKPPPAWQPEIAVDPVKAQRAVFPKEGEPYEEEVAVLMHRPTPAEIEELTDLALAHDAIAADEDFILNLVDETGFLLDLGPEFRALAEARIGHALQSLVKISGEYPFDWEPVGNIDRALQQVWSQLPGYVAESPFFFAPPQPADSHDDPLPPQLWISIEPIGIQIGGKLGENDWNAWRTAFDRLTKHLPMRTG
ncbi:MAG: hypothetical protein ABI461_23625 [Polyangiaceae bacterium]